MLFLIFLLVDGTIRTNNDGSGSGRTKNIRVQIQNTDFQKIWNKFHRFPYVFFHVFKYKAVLRIRDILVRIRIRGSVPLTNGSSYFRQWPSRWQLKITSFFKDKKPQKSHKTIGNKETASGFWSPILYYRVSIMQDCLLELSGLRAGFFSWKQLGLKQNKVCTFLCENYSK